MLGRNPIYSTLVFLLIFIGRRGSEVIVATIFLCI